MTPAQDISMMSLDDFLQHEIDVTCPIYPASTSIMMYHRFTVFEYHFLAVRGVILAQRRVRERFGVWRRIFAKALIIQA